ncbi:MAG: PhaM family polyhydroxyalkanoate granule multifunctional regulatory protein [Pseudomonadota bacterium]
MPMPQMPNIPGAAVMTDTLDFVKNLWGSMGVVPGIAAPTLSVDELDKKINDLKAVEAWLNLNTSMVRGTIQALEVQRNTIATLKSMGKTLAAAVQQPGAQQEKSLFDSIPYASAFFQHAADVMQPAAPGPAPQAQAPAPAPVAPPPPAEPAPTQAPQPAALSADAAQMANPAAWWNLLQDQFKQAVSTAMSPEAVNNATARATEVASKFAAAATKPLTKAAAAVESKTGKDKPAAAPRKAPAKRASGAKADK